MENPNWPLWNVTIHTPRLKMRIVREQDALALVELAGKGIHDPADMPFEDPWTDLPSPEFEQSMLQFFWRCAANLSAQSWRLPFAVYRGSDIVGLQDVAADDFGVRRCVITGSWLGKSYQGMGFGKEMRAGVLNFAFESLGAERAETCAFEENHASIGINRSLGYQPNGEAVTRRRDTAARDLKYSMNASGWSHSTARKMGISVSGVDDALHRQMGLA